MTFFPKSTKVTIFLIIGVAVVCKCNSTGNTNNINKTETKPRQITLGEVKSEVVDTLANLVLEILNKDNKESVYLVQNPIYPQSYIQPLLPQIQQPSPPEPLLQFQQQIAVPVGEVIVPDGTYQKADEAIYIPLNPINQGQVTASSK
ncbi:uncharacterized protein LOC130896284 [Diorhabda carinulata]|uniref:uncharacterized protein LOC130896284 n=1 Tax=Diorhabda carinulata TaxID=1163345 RepID=UPI0025A17082|nr:uncharacterized protein LOC130896284 [Diorhabda carinulata]